jgi:Asp-tRNA(Asn)/Glu-tRNA(Gln) amidotransferase B subunit
MPEPNYTQDIETICQRAITENPLFVRSYRDGRGALGPLVGWVMKETQGTCNPREVSETLTQLLGG